MNDEPPWIMGKAVEQIAQSIPQGRKMSEPVASVLKAAAAHEEQGIAL